MSESDTRVLTIVQALREAAAQEMERDDSVLIIGEDVQIGGSFHFTLGLADRFGPDRVMNMPVSESGFVGLAIGAAVQGMRPIVDFQYSDFVLEAMSQLVQQASKLRYMSGGQVKIPIVLHLPTGASGRGAQHANSIEGFFFHVPGLFLVTPATPYDAKGLMISAIRNDNPVLFAVHKHTYGSAGRHLAESSVATGHVPEEPYAIPLGVADVKREGSDVTIVSNLQMLHRSLNAAEALAQEGISVEVVDLRTLVPLDRDTIISSVRKTSRLVIVEEDNLRGGWGAEVAAVVADQALLDLDAPIKRIAAADVPVPFSPPLEEFVIPNEARIVDTVRQLLGR